MLSSKYVNTMAEFGSFGFSRKTRKFLEGNSFASKRRS